MAFKSDIIFTGYVQFVSNHPENESSWTTYIFREGGAITLFQIMHIFKLTETVLFNTTLLKMVEDCYQF